MTLDELDAVSEDIRRYAFCQEIMDSLSPDEGVEVRLAGSIETPIVFTVADLRPIAQQVQQRIIARLQAKGVTIPGVGT